MKGEKRQSERGREFSFFLNVLTGYPGLGLDQELQREKVESAHLLKFACWSPSNWLPV